MIRTEILICGGSLAGIACALRLKQLGHDPLVLEKSRFPRRKLCGEFLGPDGFDCMKQLGVWECVYADAFGPIENIFFHNVDGQAVQVRMQWMHRQYPYAFAIPRERLDSLLVQEARKADLTVLEEQRVLPDVQYKNRRFQVRTQHRSDNAIQTHHFVSDWLIDATGRNGRLMINNTPDARPTCKKTVGIQCHVRLPARVQSKDLQMFLFPGGYGGIQPISETRVNVCMLADARIGNFIHRDFQDFIQASIGQNPMAKHWLQDGVREGDFCTTADLNLDLLSPSKNNGLLRIGDAHITVDPFTGSGMAHALETGILAAETLHKAIHQKQSYQQTIHVYQDKYSRKFHRRLKLLRFFRPALSSPEIQRFLWPVLPPFLPLLTRIFR